MNCSWVVRALGIGISAWLSFCGLPVFAQAASSDASMADGGSDLKPASAAPTAPSQPTTLPPTNAPAEPNKVIHDDWITAAPAPAGSGLVLVDSRIWPEQGIRWIVPANQNPASIQVTKVCIRSGSGYGVASGSSKAICPPGSPRTLWRSDEKSTYLVLPLENSEALKALHPLRLWTALSPQKWTVAIEYQQGTDASKQSLSSTAEIEVTRRDSAALVAAMLVLVLLMLGGLLARRRVRTEAGPDAKKKTDGLIESCLNLITTPLGTYSLSMMQVLVWTAITLFGYVFLWLLDSGTPAIPEQMLGLLGVGTGTAMLSRLANGEKQALPLRYLSLVPRTERPELSDLINLDGRPSLFKFQMLGFTFVTSLMVLRALYLDGHFVAIDSSMVLLMGLSSASYLGSESLQSKPWSLVKNQVDHIEQLAKGLGVSVATREALQQLLKDAKAATPSDPAKDKGELYHELLSLEEMLTDLYSDRPSANLKDQESAPAPSLPLPPKP